MQTKNASGYIPVDPNMGKIFEPLKERRYKNELTKEYAKFTNKAVDDLGDRYKTFESYNHVVFTPKEGRLRAASDDEYAQFEAITGEHPLAQEVHEATGAYVYSGHKADEISGGHFLQGNNVTRAGSFKEARSMAAKEMDSHERVDSPRTGRVNEGKGVVSNKAKAIGQGGGSGECCIFNEYGGGCGPWNR